MNQENARNTIQKEQTDTLLCEDADTSIEFDIFPMSFAQRRMWFFYQLNPHDPAYNVPLAIRLTGRLQKDVLERCINDLIERHEGLRTVFKLEDDQPVQVIWPWKLMFWLKSG